MTPHPHQFYSGKLIDPVAQYDKALERMKEGAVIFHAHSFSTPCPLTTGEQSKMSSPSTSYCWHGEDISQ